MYYFYAEIMCLYTRGNPQVGILKKKHSGISNPRTSCCKGREVPVIVVPNVTNKLQRNYAQLDVVARHVTSFNQKKWFILASDSVTTLLQSEIRSWLQAQANISWKPSCTIVIFFVIIQNNSKRIVVGGVEGDA